MINYDIDDDHSRTVIHIDIDCFYAQVEMIKNPILYNVPLGIQQKNCVVTCNYIARNYGVKKCMSLSEAMECCPNLVLVNGEDLYSYRKISYQITSYLQRFSPKVERLGLDENFIDVTDLVAQRSHELLKYDQITGHIFNSMENECFCGCSNRLIIGSHIAQEIRQGLKNNLNLTSCAGIAHNKLLAKVVGSLHKPNEQTTVFPSMRLELMSSLGNLSCIPGIGQVSVQILNNLNIYTVEQLRSCNIETLYLTVGKEKAKLFLDLSNGRDISEVKASGKPQSIGLEDTCKMINIEAEIKMKFQQLLRRLMILVSEDGRFPTTIKVTVRKFTDNSKISHRESRQCSISSTFFTVDQNTVHLSEVEENKLLISIMRLFHKMVSTASAYHITLLGLSFTKFREPISGKNSIASYFVQDVSVQSITSIENKYPDLSNFSIHNNSNFEDSETEVEPSPKKSKYGSLLVSSQHLMETEHFSPSKLRVADLRLNEITHDSNQLNNVDTNQNICCPPNANETVFRQLPIEIQRELWNEWKTQRIEENRSQIPPKKMKTNNTLYNYFKKN